MISFPNGKINLGLHVLEKRTDGFHNIETVFYPIPWTDALEIIPSSGKETEIKTSGLRVYGTRDKNLCLRAAQLLHNLPPVSIHLHKTIPVGAGLGGGSSDAAHTLLLLNRICKLGLDSASLEKHAASLGSDCAFFIQNKPAFASGRGERIEPISLKLKSYFAVVVKPRVHIRTAVAYDGIRPLKKRTGLKEIIGKPVEQWKDTLVNDFEQSIFELYPGIRNIKKKLYNNGAVYASMSGSGSSVYGLFREEKNLSAYFRSCTLWQGWLS